MRLIIGVSGGSGVIYAIRLLEVLHTLKIDTHLIISRWAKECIRLETDKSIDYVTRLANKVYDNDNLASAPSSGSFKTDGMVIIPCSMKTLASIANGYDDNLITRAATVSIKEGRKLVLVPRETPLTAIHLENMLKLARLGIIILPAMPGFYHKPKSIDELLNHIVGKILDQFGIEHEIFERWKGEEVVE
ncbi:MAG: putative UbiX-like flavin prenyltransferase [Candidatus Nitrosocaldaceae archaeon]|nr:MAG: putative UbiX-like flavin prenyltransferase [Candidatus Nitrosocaldaceae archaeon]